MTEPIEPQFYFPAYALPIIERLIELDWFVHCFQIETSEELYNPVGYLYNHQINNVEYHLVLDTNVYQFLLNAIKKSGTHQEHRDAIAMVVFCQFSDIVIEPAMAIYEKINYNKAFPEEVFDDLVLMRNIENSNMEELAKFALGYTADFPVAEMAEVDREDMRGKLTQYERLRTWENLYVTLLKIIDIHFNEAGKPEHKFRLFLDWCHFDFMNSIAATCFAINLFFFSRSLMKFKQKEPGEKKKKAIVNMTWDLYIIHQFFSRWVKKRGEVETLYASSDLELRNVLKLGVSIQLDPSAQFLKGKLPDGVITLIAAIDDRAANDAGRKVSKNMPGFEDYRKNLIAALETKLGVITVKN